VAVDAPRGAHVCWIVEDDAAYVEQAAALLDQGGALGEKRAAFGPEGSADLAALAGSADLCADPRVAFLDGGPLRPDLMLRAFEEQAASARSEGFTGLRVVADMDWLLPTGAAEEAAQAFELLLDAHARRLGVTVVCAYRTSSFGDAARLAVRCVHPVEAGCAEPPPFRLVAGEDGAWRLAGEVDLAVQSAFAVALDTAVETGDCVLDASALDFIDLDALRRIALHGAAGVPVRVVNARPVFRRVWAAAGFDEVAPGVELIAS
jgi:anti-anti-sigma regulatory factor